MGTTAVYGFRYPELGDAPDGPKLGRELAQDVEAALQGNLTLGANLTVPGNLVVNGQVTGNLAVSGSLTVAGTNIAVRPRGLVAWYSRPTQKAASTGEHGQLRIDNVALLAGRAYALWTAPLNVDGAALDILATRFRYSTAGAATTASTEMPGSYTPTRQEDPNVAEALTMQTVYIPVGNETFSVLLTIQGVINNVATTVLVGGGAACTVYIEDIGTAPAASGTSI